MMTFRQPDVTLLFITLKKIFNKAMNNISLCGDQADFENRQKDLCIIFNFGRYH